MVCCFFDNAAEERLPVNHCKQLLSADVCSGFSCYLYLLSFVFEIVNICILAFSHSSQNWCCEGFLINSSWFRSPLPTLSQVMFFHSHVFLGGSGGRSLLRHETQELFYIALYTIIWQPYCIVSHAILYILYCIDVWYIVCHGMILYGIV